MVDGAMQSFVRRKTAQMTDRGTMLNIVSWMLLAVVVCTLIARFAMKLSMKTKRRRLGLDDFFIALAALFSFGQTVAVSIESIRVLGQHVVDLSAEQILVYQKAEYAACMLYIANMGCSRISVCLVIKKALPGRVPKYAALGFATFTALWMVSGVLVTAFACSLPNPWQFIRNNHRSTECYDVVTFVNYIGITNIVVEIILVIIPLVVWNVKLSAARRVSVSLVFLARLGVVAAVAAQLYFWNRLPLSDFSYTSWPAALCQQIAQNLAVITACLPCLHPFIAKVIAGTIEPEPVTYKCHSNPFVRRIFDRKPPVFDTTSSRSSRSSITPLTEKSSEPYCRPLATYGLDRASNHRRTHSSSHFPPNCAKPVFDPQPPENIFNRFVEVPVSRPCTSGSTADPLATPKNLKDVGILPTLDWETESSNSGGSRRSSPTRNPTAEYVFNRQQVISVSEENHIYDDGSKKFAPPLPSPRWPKRPPRAF